MMVRKLLARQGTIEILLFIQKNKSPHFGKISKVTKSDQIATERLKDLVKMNFVNRKVMQDARRTVQYTLTNKGKELIEIARKIKDMEDQ